MTDPASILDAHRPDWHTTLVETSDGLHCSVNGLFGALQVAKHKPSLQAYGAEKVLAMTQLQPLVTDRKNSWSNNFKAKVLFQHKAHAATDVTIELLDVALMLHVLSADNAYTNLYELICPPLSYRHLTKEQMGILTKVFGRFNGTSMKVERLEHKFWKSIQNMRTGPSRNRIPRCQQTR